MSLEEAAISPTGGIVIPDNELDQQQDVIPRRDVLRRGLNLGLSLTPLLLILPNTYHIIDSKNNLFPEKKERYLSQSKEGYRIGAILGNHGDVDLKNKESKSVRSTQIHTEDLFQPVGAFFNDGFTQSLDPRVSGDDVEFIINRALQSNPDFYKAPFEYGLANDIPFIFGDINLKGVSFDSFTQQAGQSADLSNKALLSVLAALVAQQIPQITEKYTQFFQNNLTRRELFKLVITGGGLLGAAYFSTPAINSLARALGLKPDSDSMRDFQTIYTDLIHPDRYVFIMRNIVWALKCRDLYETGLIPREKIVNVLGGADHQFLDFFIRHPDVAQKYWEIFNYKKIAGEFSQGDLSWVHQSLIYYPKSKRIEIIEHPGLKALTI